MNGLSGAAIVIAPRLADNVPLMGVALVGALYWRGGSRRRSAKWRSSIGPERDRAQRHRTLAFVAALVTLIVALQEPLDGLADEYFWAHMTQHVLLLVVAAPLLVLAAPWVRLWRAVPLRPRRILAKAMAKSSWAAPLRAVAYACGIPVVAWALMNVDIVAWHIPAAYDLTLRSAPVHYAEHASFVLFAVLAWAQVIDSQPFRSRLDTPHRIAFALASMVVGWTLALALAFARSPWYAPYAAHRTGGISALADQQLAAGVMWVPASLPWSLLVFVLLYRWLSDRESSYEPRSWDMASQPATEPSRSSAQRPAMASTIETARRINV